MMHKDNAQYDQCHVYNIVQLLLRLSNDVEENPGPTISDISIALTQFMLALIKVMIYLDRMLENSV